MNKYLSKKYLHLSRMQAYLEQYKYVEDGDTILEIGNAGGVFQSMASKIANYKSADVDKNSNPDFLIDLSSISEEEKNKIGKFNEVFCCEVLEHIPFDKLNSLILNKSFRVDIMRRGIEYCYKNYSIEVVAAKYKKCLYSSLN